MERARAVCSSGTKYGCAPADAGRRQLEHAGTERSQDAPLGGHRSLERIEGVEVVDHLRIRAGVVGHDGPVAGAEAEDEAPREPALQGDDGRPDHFGRARPDADDAAGHRHLARRREQLFEVRRKPGVEASR